MTPLELADAVKARATAGQLSWFDGKPDSSAGDRYLCLYMQAGMLIRDRYTNTAGDQQFQVTVVCAARTEDGLRDAVHVARALFEGHRPDPSPAASALTETVTGPRLSSGPAGDQRLSQTLIYRMYTSRSINV